MKGKLTDSQQYSSPWIEFKGFHELEEGKSMYSNFH